jgi:hypothetical protein
MDCCECGNQVSSSWYLDNPGTDVCEGCHQFDRPAVEWSQAEED